ncbi:MAG: ABC transporter ATP-binding protein [Spirochaetales bacterium]|nr:ABC transporter ATP-binding protein [Spirochaetales bacterium]
MHRFVRFFSYLKPFVRWILFLFALIMANMLLGIPGPLLQKAIIDQALSEGKYQLLVTLAIIIAGISLLSAFFTYLRNIISVSLREKVLAKVRVDIYSHLQRLSMHFFSKQQSGSLLSRMVNDVSYIQNLVNDEFFYLFSSAIRVVIVVLLMFSLSWQLTLLSLVALPVLVIVFLMLRKRIYQFSKRMQELYAHLSGKIQENISAIKIIQAETVEEQKQEETALMCDNLASVSISQSKVAIKGNFAVTVFSSVPLLLVIWMLGGAQVIEGSLTLGTLLAFSQYLFSVIGPVSRFFSFNLSLQAGYAAMDRIYDILDKPPDIVDSAGAQAFSKELETIEFKGLSLEFQGDDDQKPLLALDNINLKIEKGEKIGIVGPSGGGKTSLINLLLRFYKPTSGGILLNGENLEQFTIASLRQNISYMPQEEYLFNDTIRANLALGRDYSDRDLQDALERSYAWEFVKVLDKGLNTVIGERGATLSGGQRQRLALARVFLKKPQLFIFDEAFSALDAQSEQLIFKALKSLLKETTAIIIAHRFSFLHLVNRILVFSEGHLIEDGTISELRDHEGLFARLFLMQQLEEGKF